MIAHSFRGELFGPAQNVHGATFVIRVAFLADELDAHGIVVDIARAQALLKDALGPLNYRNLDELPQFKGVNTTTEFLTRHLFEHFAATWAPARDRWPRLRCAAGCRPGTACAPPAGRAGAPPARARVGAGRSRIRRVARERTRGPRLCAPRGGDER